MPGSKIKWTLDAALKLKLEIRPPEPKIPIKLDRFTVILIVFVSAMMAGLIIALFFRYHVW